MNLHLRPFKSRPKVDASFGGFGVAVKAIIIHDGCILLLRRSSSDTWNPGELDLPGGRLHIGETAAEGLEREVREETGLGVHSCFPISVWNFVDGGGTSVVGITFASQCHGRQVRLSDEHIEYMWVNLIDVQSIRLPQVIRDDIDALMSQLPVKGLRLPHGD